MRAKYARQIRQGITSARRDIARTHLLGYSPPFLSPVDGDLGWKAYRYTIARDVQRTARRIIDKMETLSEKLDRKDETS